MVKLTTDLVNQSIQHFNPCEDRELVLRGFKIPVIENLGATLDQFDCIDLSDNDIRKLDGFPLLKRLKMILLNNNRIVRIGEDLHECLPSLESIYMTNNLLHELADLDPLAKFRRLEYVSFLGNPVATKPHYRLYLINKVPHLRVIDFRRVRLFERESAKRLFKSAAGKELKKEIHKTRTFVPGSAGQSDKNSRQPNSGRMSSDVQKAIRQEIANASSMEEVERLQHMLRTGNLPGKNASRSNGMVEDDD